MSQRPGTRRFNTDDLLAGAIFIGFGLFFALDSLGLKIGTAFRMGPGFFPLALAIILILLGIAVAAQSLRSIPAAREPIPWRGLVLILAPLTLFGLFIRGLGLAPSIAMVVVISAFASRQMTWRFAVPLAVGLAVFCQLIFGVGLGLPLPMFGPWLTGG